MAEIVEAPAPEVIEGSSVVEKLPDAPKAEGDKPKPAGDAPAPKPDEVKPATEDTPDKGLRRLERRIDKATRLAAEQKARADFLDQKLKEFEQSIPKAETPGKPRMEDFTDIQEYAKAYAKFESENAIKEHEAKRTEELNKAAQEKIVSNWEAASAKAEKKYEDFDEVVGDLKPTSPWAVAIMESENGADIAYYLGTHIKDAQRITTLSPIAQIREIGKLEAKLSLEPPKPKVSSAPAPITPVSGTAGAPTDQLTKEDEKNTGEWIRKRSKQAHGR